MRWGALQGSNGKSIVICDGLLFLFKHLSFLKQSPHNPSTAVNRPQSCAWGCVVLFWHMSYGEMGPSLTIFRIIRRNRRVPSKINLITLSFALRPIAKLCLLHGPSQTWSKSLLVLSMAYTFFGRERGVIVSTRAFVVLQMCESLGETLGGHQLAISCMFSPHTIEEQGDVDGIRGVALEAQTISILYLFVA